MQHLGLAPTMSLIITWGFEEKNFVVVIFGVWIFGLLQIAGSDPHDMN